MTEQVVTAEMALNPDEHHIDAAIQSDTATPSELFVIDLGRKSRKKLKRLRQGKGPLMEDVGHVVRQLRDSGQIDAAAVPIVFIASTKEKSMDQNWFG